MLRKKMYLLTILLLGLIMAITMGGCDLINAIQDIQDSTGNGWPTPSQLNKVGLNGFNRPDAASNITWLDYSKLALISEKKDALLITFDGTNTTNTKIRDYFKSWTVIDNFDSTGSVFRKNNWQVTYAWTGNGGTILSEKI